MASLLPDQIMKHKPREKKKYLKPKLKVDCV